MTRTQRPSPRSKHTRPRPATTVAALAKLDQSVTALREEAARTMALARLAARAIKAVEAAHEQAERTYRDARRLHERVRRLHRKAS